MKTRILILSLIMGLLSCEKAPIDLEDKQDTVNIYFPPIGSDDWETTEISDLGWNEEALEDLLKFIEANGTRAFMILKEGKIVVEEYWNRGLLNQEFKEDTNWYWASAAKSMTSFLVGQAMAQGNIDLNQPSSTYLGNGWSSLNKDQEDNIKVYHHLSMSSGLDDSENVHCTEPQCLKFLAEPGARWAYHNGPYTILDQILEGATATDFDKFFEDNLKNRIGMDGFWMYQGYNHLYFSTARSMARFGLLALNKGVWNGEDLMNGNSYFEESTKSSQELNPSYGYLWWLNGKSSFMLPSVRTEFPEALNPDAPEDMFSALGKNSQVIDVVPSEGLVLVRMGADPDESLVPINFHRSMWEKLMKVIDN